MRCFTSLLILLAAGLSGCKGRIAGELWYSGEFDIVRSGGLVLGIEVPKRQFAVGETFPVRITAQNQGKDPITITAKSTSPVYVLIYRHDGIGWEELLHYPKAEMMVVRTWTLAPGAARRYSLNLTVEPNWPTGEPLRVAAVVNGLPGPEAGVEITITGRIP